jgi:hypothetical protein
MRQWMVIASFVAFALQSSLASAQTSRRADTDDYKLGSDSSATSPEMYFYLDQQRRHDDPKLSVRAKAEKRANERRQRIAARKWFGLSNARPLANPTPWFGTYSPMWSGSFWNPFVWSGYQSPAYVILSHGVIGPGL